MCGYNTLSCELSLIDGVLTQIKRQLLSQTIATPLDDTVGLVLMGELADWRISNLTHHFIIVC